MGSDEAVINTIFVHARDIFLCDIPGTSIVVGALLSAISNFIHSGTSTSATLLQAASPASPGSGQPASTAAASPQRSSLVVSSSAELPRRASALQLVVNMVCIPSALGEVSLPRIPGEAPTKGVYDALAISCHTMLDRFVREDAVASLKIRSLYGLGLAIADELARANPRQKLVKNILRTIQEFCQCSLENVRRYPCILPLSLLGAFFSSLECSFLFSCKTSSPRSAFLFLLQGLQSDLIDFFEFLNDKLIIYPHT